MFTSTSRPPKVSTAVLTRRCAPSQLGDVVAVGDSLAAHGLDLLDDLLRGAGRGRTRAVHLAAEVVDDDLGPVLGEHQRVLPTDASAGAGDDAHAPLTHSCHVLPPR